ncbi:hypothetical protein [Streptomyces sp. NPDC050535]|uniref:hypothetical protein n=1 Tax=Streptomyces sp. NPDC050535 TaxID=3365626 RepID=UPI0037AF83F7
MPHVEPARLAELALGNNTSDIEPSTLRHIAACDCCRQELSRMTRVVIAARSVEEADLPTAPPDRVWQHLAQNLSEPQEKTDAPPWAKPAPVPSAPSAGSRLRPHNSADTRIRTIRLTLGLLSGIIVLWWWSRSTRTAARPETS